MLRRLFNICFAGSLIVTLALVGCSGTQGNSDPSQIKLGMTKAEVIKIMGKPQERETKPLCALTEEVLRWRLGTKTIVLTITNNRVSGRQVIGTAKKAQES
ncbi:MAG: hypothetical protein ACYDIC_12770 [Desulfobaccales bacterium]